MDLKKFCKDLPKIELHAHLNGSLSRETLKKLGCLNTRISEYNLTKQSEKTLDDCFHLFRIAHEATNNKEAVYQATKGVIEEFSSDNVIYLEIRTTPRSGPEMTKVEYIESVVKAIEKVNCKNIIVKLLLSIDRRFDTKECSDTMEIIINMKEKYPDIIKGVDLSGNPHVGTFNKKLFSEARNRGLLVSLHCAEIKNDKEVLEMLKFKPDRIGHATNLHPKYGGSEEIWDLYQQLQIPTDDKGVFNTSLSEEFVHAAENFNLNFHDLHLISYNAIEYSFASNEEKDNLRLKLQQWMKEQLVL